MQKIKTVWQKFHLHYFFVLILILFLPMLWGKTLFFGDNYSLIVPGKIFSADWLRQGILPVWNPYIMAGLPWLADINQSVLFPSTFLFIFFQPAMALNLSIIGSLLIGWLGAVALAKKVSLGKYQPLFAIIWLFSVPVISAVNNLSILQSLVFFPWILSAGIDIGKSRKAKFIFAWLILLQFLAGYPQHVIYSILGSVLFSIFFPTKIDWQKWWIAWIETAIWTVLLSCVVWLPLLKVLFESTRSIQTNAQATAGSIHPISFIQMLIPHFFDQPVVGMAWGKAFNGQTSRLIYLGWLGWLIFFVHLLKKKTKWDWFVMTFFLVSSLLSFGQYLPGYSILQNMILLLKIGRYPNMILILTNLFTTLWLVKKMKSWQFKFNKKVFYFVSLVTGLFLIMWLGSIFLFEPVWFYIDQLLSFKLSNSIFHTLARDKIIIQVISLNLLLSSLSLASSFYFWSKQKVKFLNLIIGLEMIFVASSLLFWAPNQIYPSLSQIKERQSLLLGQKIDPQYRLLTRNSNQPYTDFHSYWSALTIRQPFSDSFIDQQELFYLDQLQRLSSGLTPDWNMVYGVPVVNGYTTMVPLDYSFIWQKSDQPRINFIDQLDLDDPQIRDWAVGYYLVDDWYQIDEQINQDLLEKQNNYSLYQVYGKARFRYENDLPVVFDTYDENPNRIRFDIANAEGHTNLIVADRYDTDWRVKIDGVMQPIENVDGMRRIKISDQTSRVEFFYLPRLFLLGLLISGVTGILMLIVSKHSN